MTLRYSLVGEIIERECKTLDKAMEAAYMHEEHLTGLPLEIIGSKRYTRNDMHEYWEQKGWKLFSPRDGVVERAIRRDYIISNGLMKRKK